MIGVFDSGIGGLTFKVIFWLHPVAGCFQRVGLLKRDDVALKKGTAGFIRCLPLGSEKDRRI